MSEPFPSPIARGVAAADPTAPSVDSTPQTVAVTRFKSCRWRRPPDEGTECCGHRDVLPIAGTTASIPKPGARNALAYKLRRTPRNVALQRYRVPDAGLLALDFRLWASRAAPLHHEPRQNPYNRQ